MAKETALTARIMRYAASQGCLARKLHMSGYSDGGWPDVEILVPVVYQHWAVPLFVEVKQPGKQPMPRQAKRLRDLVRFGAVAVWVDTFEKFVQILREVKEQPCGFKHYQS